MGGKLTILVFIAALLSCGHSVDWFGAGNWTADNLTDIKSKMNAFDRSVSE
jgi:hypothetical protein